MSAVVVAVAGGVVGVLLFAGCASTSSPTVDAGAQVGTVVQTRGTVGSVLATTNDTTPGTLPSTDPTSGAGAGSNGSTSTLVAPVANAGVSTTAPTGASTLVPTTRAGGIVPPTPAPPAAPTTPVPTAPPTTAAPPTLNASGPNGDTQVHCMGTAQSAQASPTWTSTNATKVAVAPGNVADAFTSPVNPNLLRTSGTYPVTLDCNGPPQQYTTVTAMGPGGTTTVLITWNMHKM